MGLFVGYSQKRRTVRIDNLGEPQTLICPLNAVQLMAVLTDSTNLRNHTIYWEQIKGAPVVLSSQYELNPTYAFVENTNKLFRFYLDYGTNKEQYKEIEVFHTPTSIISRVTSSGEDNSVYPTIPDYTLTPEFIVPLDDYSYAPVTLTPAMRIEYSALSLGLQGQLVGSEILTSAEYTHNPQDTFKSYEPGDDPRSHLLIRGVYKFITYSKRDVDIIRYRSPLIVSSPPEQTDKGDPYVNEVANASRSVANLVQDAFSRTIYSIKSIVDNEQKSSSSKGFFEAPENYNGNDTFTRTTYTIKSFNDHEHKASRSFAEFNSIIRFDNSGIGS